MDKFVLIIDNYKLYIFQINDKKGPELIKIEDKDFADLVIQDPSYSTDKIKEHLLYVLNYNDFRDCSFKVIYNEVGINVIQSLMDSFSTAADFEINKLKHSLISILLKLEKILNGQTKVVKFHDNNWEIKLDKDGSSSIIKTDDKQDITLNVEDIPVALHGNFSFTRDKKEVVNLRSNLAKVEKELQMIKEGFPKFKKQRVEESVLEERDGVTYIKGENEPFNGYKIIYHLDSKLVKSEIPYINGEKSGTQIDYKEDGLFTSIINYNEGNEDGSVISFQPSGEINKVYHAKNGKKHKGYISFNMDSQNISNVINYKDGKKHGSEVEFNSDKLTIDTLTNYKDGKKHGSYINIFPDTNYIWELKTYKNGNLNGHSIVFNGNDEYLIGKIHYLLDYELSKQSLDFRDGYLSKTYYRESKKEINYNNDGTVDTINDPDDNDSISTLESTWNFRTPR